MEVDSQLKDDIFSWLLEDRGKARLGSLGLPHAGAWLNVIPSQALYLNIKPAESRFVVRYRLGIPVFALVGKCPACTIMSDKFGDHESLVGIVGNILHDALYQTVVTANLAPSREE